MTNLDKESFIQKNQKKVIGGVFLLFIFMIIFTGDSSTNPPAQVEMQSSAFNIPSLVGLNLDQLISQLGTPEENTEPTQANLASGHTTTWEKTWKKGDFSLMATYDIKSREVVDLFFTTNRNLINTSAEMQQLLDAGKIPANLPNYSVKFVKAVNGQGYTGVIITSK